MAKNCASAATEKLRQRGNQCSDGVCYSQLLNSRDTLERLAKKLGYELS